MFRPSVLSKALPFQSFRLSALRVSLRQAMVTCLILLLISNNAFAMPGIAQAFADLGQELSFRWHSNGWAAAFNQSFIGSFFNSSSTTQRGWDGIGAPNSPQLAAVAQIRDGYVFRR